jgi:hypothetical protein
MIIDTRVCGIPCQARSGYSSFKKGAYSLQAETPDEYYGHSEVEFEVLDRRGRPAPWLTRKLSVEDTDRIESELIDALKEEHEQDF